VLDAFVAEARIRWGLDPAAGLQIVTPERLTSTPIEPSRPVLVVPLAAFRAGEPTEPADEPLPGRHATVASGAIGVLRRLYPADHPVGRIGATEAATIADLDEAALTAPLYLAPVAPELAFASPGPCRGSRTGCASPTAVHGIESRLTPRSRSIFSRRRTRSTTRSTAARLPTWPASSAISTCRSCCTRSSPPRQASST